MLLFFVLSSQASDVPPDYWKEVFQSSLRDINWAWMWGILAPWFLWLTITAVIIVVVRTLVDRLIDKLTAKKRLKRDIEESIYWKEVDRIADEELHYRHAAMRYTEIEAKKTDKNKIGRK